MRDPHRLLYVLALIFTPVGWALAAGYRAAKILRDMRYRPRHMENR